MAFIGNNYIKLDLVDSTNNYAMAQIHAGLTSHGFVYIARQQTAGKGQRGKTWNTHLDESLIMSVVLQPHSSLYSNKFILSAAIAVACHDFTSIYAGNNTKIKWPNDIYWNDRKAGGILIENILQGSEWKYAVVGIGLNINQNAFSEPLKNAVSFKQITGKDWDIFQLIEQLCKNLEARYQQAISQPEQLFKEYCKHLYKLNEEVLLRYNNIVFKTIIKSVNREGKLITENAHKEDFNPGELEWLPEENKST